jgi:hypothetical protein
MRPECGEERPRVRDVSLPRGGVRKIGASEAGAPFAADGQRASDDSVDSEQICAKGFGHRFLRTKKPPAGSGKSRGRSVRVFCALSFRRVRAKKTPAIRRAFESSSRFYC